MKINHSTMLFEDFTPQESIEMLSFARNLIISCTVPSPLPIFVNIWMREFNFNEDQKYLILATVFPQKILLSIIDNTCK